MNNKQKKLFDHVVSDLFKNTDVNFPAGYIKLPFISPPNHHNYYRLLKATYPNDNNHFRRFSKYCEIYALSDMEITMVWTLYREKVNREIVRQKKIVREIEKRLMNGESLDGIDLIKHDKGR
jgi:hypothetical protein